ncbi:MAG: TPM domain-containing protein [Planctomycetes bacterium]|nr:TPM domain-containing protein [Planctomycetota bacterium]
MRLARAASAAFARGTLAPARAIVLGLVAVAALLGAPHGAWATAAIVATEPAAAPALDVDVPANDGWVTDLAGLLTAPEERELEAAMEAYKRGSGHDIALLTVRDLDGRTIEEFALEVARAWKLGSVETSDGALLVVAKDDRKLRIEVGRGLEGTLTDARCAQIIRNDITPQFKAGRFGDGLRNGIAAMQAAAGGAPVNVRRSIPEPAPKLGIDFGGLACTLLVLFFLLAILSRLRRYGGGWATGRRPGGGVFWGGHFGGGGFGRGGGGGGFSGFGGGGGFSGGGSSGSW